MLLSMRLTTFILFMLVSVCSYGQTATVPVAGQTKGQLFPMSKEYYIGERKKLMDEIAETEKQLSAIKQDKNATLSQLRALQSKLAQRQNLIGNINSEINDIDNTIKTSSKEVITLKQKLEQMKIRYAQSIRYAYSTRSSFGMLAFLFSSADFNDAMRRMKYLKKFRDFRKDQVDQIHATQNQLQRKIGVLNVEKAEKDELLGKQVQQKQELEKDANQTNKVVQELKGRESELMKNIEKNRVVAARINKAIQLYIEAEMAKEAKKAEDAKAAALAKVNTTPGAVKPPVKTNTTPGTTVISAPKATTTNTKAPPKEIPSLLLTPTNVELAGRFEGNKGKLYWPVDKGYITDHFGVHSHPVYTSVKITNSGIDIQSDENASVHAVFDGDVTKVFSADGTNQVIMLSHGNYFTVYSGLSNAQVKIGDHVSVKQVIGHVGKNMEDLPVVNFQIWKSGAGKKSQVPLNPEAWIGKLR